MQLNPGAFGSCMIGVLEIISQLVTPIEMNHCKSVYIYIYIYHYEIGVYGNYIYISQ